MRDTSQLQFIGENAYKKKSPVRCKRNEDQTRHVNSTVKGIRSILFAPQWTPVSERGRADASKRHSNSAKDRVPVSHDTAPSRRWACFFFSTQLRKLSVLCMSRTAIPFAVLRSHGDREDTKCFKKARAGMLRTAKTQSLRRCYSCTPSIGNEHLCCSIFLGKPQISKSGHDPIVRISFICLTRWMVAFLKLERH